MNALYMLQLKSQTNLLDVVFGISVQWKYSRCKDQLQNVYFRYFQVTVLLILLVMVFLQAIPQIVIFYSSRVKEDRKSVV